MDKNLTPEQKHILLEEGTEPPGTSSLNYEKREGYYYCVGWLQKDEMRNGFKL